MSWHLDDVSLAAWHDGTVDMAVAASVEQHLLTCAQCRTKVGALVDRAPLALAWAQIQAGLQVTPPTPVGRLLSRLGVPDSESVVLLAAPSLRMAWLTGAAVTLLFAATATVWAGEAALNLFLLVAPLVPVAGVALAYGPANDPTHELGTVAPYSTARVALLRVAAVAVTSIPPALAVGALLPGPLWLAASWLLPALAFTGIVLAASTWTDPRSAATLIALAWVAANGAATLRHLPLVLVAPPAQLLYLALAFATAVVLPMRLRDPDVLGRTP